MRPTPRGNSVPTLICSHPRVHAWGLQERIMKRVLKYISRLSRTVAQGVINKSGRGSERQTEERWIQEAVLDMTGPFDTVSGCIRCSGLSSRTKIIDTVYAAVSPNDTIANQPSSQ